jgi:asparagine synthase (glutamine-hydrolysing)
MSSALAHRGPDGEAVQALTGRDGSERGWFGHRRLRILDLTDAASQPMQSADGRSWLVFNGEIYNFAELRKELEGLGHRFSSKGDTEVLMRAYEEWGEALVERIDGMYAFAIWDGAREQLLLCRDRVGKKPLFYALAEGRLIFASEVKSLARTPWLRLRARMEALPQLLMLGYVPWPNTPFEGVKQVAPGAIVRFDPRQGALEAREYWSGLPAQSPRAPAPDLPGEVRALLETATKRRMVADVPIGCLLSGGVDSSVVAALMSRQSAEPIRTFSIGFPDEKSFDERRWARTVADHVGARHLEFAVQADAVSILDRLIWLHDGPFGDSSAVPTSLVCELARQHVTVVLTGDGGDEVFAGYERFAAAALSQHVPAVLLKLLGPAAARLPGAETSYSSLGRRVRRFSIAGDLLERYTSWVSIFDRSELPGLLGTPLASDDMKPLRSVFERARSLPDLDRLLYVNLRTYLPDDLAVKLDRCSMGHGLEVRSPLLDTTLVERLGRIRASDRVGFLRAKPLLRRSCKELLPASIWKRRKHGFGVPVDRWFRDDLAPLVEDELMAADSRVQTVLNGPALRRLWADHREGRARHGAQLWTLLTVERWLRDLEKAEPLLEPTPIAASAGQLSG